MIQDIIVQNVDEVVHQTFELFPNLETSIFTDIRMLHFYAACFVIRKDSPCLEKISNDTAFYHQKYGDF